MQRVEYEEKKVQVGFLWKEKKRYSEVMKVPDLVRVWSVRDEKMEDLIQEALVLTRKRANPIAVRRLVQKDYLKSACRSIKNSMRSMRSDTEFIKSNFSQITL
jgi:hypothetical protein